MVSWWITSVLANTCFCGGDSRRCLIRRTVAVFVTTSVTDMLAHHHGWIRDKSLQTLLRRLSTDPWQSCNDSYFCGGYTHRCRRSSVTVVTVTSVTVMFEDAWSVVVFTTTSLKVMFQMTGVNNSGCFSSREMQGKVKRTQWFYHSRIKKGERQRKIFYTRTMMDSVVDKDFKMNTQHVLLSQIVLERRHEKD